MTTETVSGRTYTSTRVRGFAPWNPRADTQLVLDQVQGVLAEYRAQLPMTARQIFYRLVGAHGYPKTEQSYARLCEYLNRGRRAGLISFHAIRDDGTTSLGGRGWTSPESFWRSIKYWADQYEHNLRDGQPYHVEVWVEAAGMAPQIATVAGDYDISTYSAGGFNGLTDKHETATRLSRVNAQPVVLHIGDYDPSGLSIIDSLADDINALTAGMGAVYDIDWRRIVVTPEQIERFSLPSAPQKVTDRRGEQMDETVQAEALPPDVLAGEVRAAIDEITDHDAMDAARELGEQEREAIREQFERLSGDD